jgi:hypothetical protein
MSKKNFRHIALFFLSAIALTFMLISSQAEEPPAHTPDQLLKHLGMIIKEDLNSVPRVNKQAALTLAAEYFGLSHVAKDVHAQYNILTYKGIKTAGISEKARNANPKLKEAAYIKDIPVWIVSYQGLNLKRAHGVVLHEHNIVIDAETGELLFGFKYR